MWIIQSWISPPSTLCCLCSVYVHWFLNNHSYIQLMYTLTFSIQLLYVCWYSALVRVICLSESYVPRSSLLASLFMKERRSICFHLEAGQMKSYLAQPRLQGTEEECGYECVCVWERGASKEDIMEFVHLKNRGRAHCFNTPWQWITQLINLCWCIRG